MVWLGKVCFREFLVTKNQHFQRHPIQLCSRYSMPSNSTLLKVQYAIQFNSAQGTVCAVHLDHCAVRLLQFFVNLCNPQFVTPSFGIAPPAIFSSRSTYVSLFSRAFLSYFQIHSGDKDIGICDRTTDNVFNPRMLPQQCTHLESWFFIFLV
jgi:hypothetical protein